MEDIEDHGRTRDRVLGKIGRNLHLFQEAEHLLKRMSAMQKRSLVSDGDSGGLRQIEPVEELQTMGGAVGRVLDGPREETEEELAEIADKHGIHIGLSVKESGDAKFLEAREMRWRQLVAARNDLVHQFYARFSLGSNEECLEAESYLDEQFEEQVPTVERLRSSLTNFRDSLELQIELLKNREVRTEHLFGPSRDRFVDRFREIAHRRARGDGWTPLGAIGQELTTEEREELEALKEGFDMNTLRDLISATGCFELAEETTEKGGIRVVLRPTEVKQ